MWIVVLVIYLAICGVIAYFMQNVAFAKGYDTNAHTFAMCFWLGIFGCLYVVALPDLVARQNQVALYELLNKEAETGSVVTEETAVKEERQA